ncbi:MAG TPA: ABC transporter ATP-binding protein [Tissierellia bacterium]|nr:ABC transporter ATP-binding protein [Tissierellia bacterium]
MKPLFQIENMSVAYGKKSVIRGADLAIYPGETCALLGLNGSGKTTLLRAACGLIASDGKTQVGEVSLDGLTDRQRAKYLSYIPQMTALVRGKSVFEIVLMGANPHLHLLESPGPTFHQAAREALARLQLTDLREQEFDTLSQGQKQLVVLARSIVQDTPVMLMDEPDSALDFRNRHLVLGVITRLIREQQRAGLITMHDPNFAMAYCDRLLLLKHGDIIGQIEMNRDSHPLIQEKLSQIYGPIELIRHRDSYFMLQRT